MSNPPIGWHTITPRIFTDDPEGLVEFVKRTFEDGWGNVWQIAAR